MSDQEAAQEAVDLAAVAQRARAEVLAALIETSRQRPVTSVGVAAMKVILELAGQQGGKLANGFTPEDLHRLTDDEREALGIIMEKLTKGTPTPPDTAVIVAKKGHPNFIVTVLPHRELALTLEERIDRLIAQAPVETPPASSHAPEDAPATPAPTIPRTEPEPTPPTRDEGYIATMIRQNGAYFPGD